MATEITADGVSQIQNNTVTAADLQDSAVTANKIAAGAVGASQIAAGAVDSDQIASSAITSAKIASGAVESAMTTQIGGRRNLIINGAMQVAQRGTSFTDPSSGTYTLDRWVSGLQTTSGAGDFSQATDVPTATEAGTAFKNSLKFQVTTADTSIAATDRTYIIQKIEGQNLAPAGFGQSGTRYMTLSFWHKHTKTGTHSLAFNNGDRNRSYPMEYTQTTSNTWEKAQLTFPVDTSGTWATDNGIGMWIFWGIAFGSNYAGTANAWGSSQVYGTSNQVNNLDSTSNTMLFTGVQLEVGSVATPFEHRSFGEEMELCKRYYQKSFDYGTAPAFDASENQVGISMAYNASTATGGAIELGVEMRTTPTVTYYSRNVTTGNYWGMYKNTTWTVTTTGNNGSRSKRIQFYVQPSGGGMTAQNVYELSGNWTAEAEL